MYADCAPPSLIDPITHCVFCDPVVSSCTGNTYSQKTVINFGMKDPYSMETIEKLIPNRNKQEEIESFYQDKFKETVGRLVTKSLDQNVEEIVELIAMVVDRSDLQACLNGQRLLIELIQSSTNDQLGRFKAKLGIRGLGWVAKLVEKQNATILKDRLGIDISSLATAMLLPPQPVPIVPPPAASAASIIDSDDEEEYDFSDTESTTSSVGYTDEKTYVFVDKMPPKTTDKHVRHHFNKFKDSMTGRILFIKGSNGTKARLTFKTSESALEAIELMNKSFFSNSSTPISVKMWVTKRKQKSEPKAPKQHSRRKKNILEPLVGEPVTTIDVYVGNNLPSSVTENDIKVHFKMFEPSIQRVLLIKDPTTKQSKGFAKVTFNSLQAAQTAVEKLHKTQLARSKHRLVVNLWKVKKEAGEMPVSPTKSIPEEDTKNAEMKPRQRKKQNSTSEQVSMIPDLKDEPKEELVGLTIENVSVQISGDQLKLMLESFGDIKRYSIIPAAAGETIYKAEVYFSSREEADDTISHLNGNQLAGEKVLVQYIPQVAKKMSIETFGVYVGRIPKPLHKPEFEQIFAKYGKISSVFLLSDKKYGYVNYFRMEDAKAALDMNNREVYGSKLKVNMASKKTMESSVEVPAQIPPTSDSGPSNLHSLPSMPKESSPSKPTNYTVVVRSLSPLTTKEKLTSLVERYGSLTSPVHLIKGDPPYAYVNYSTIEAANAACLYLHGQNLDGKIVQVKIKVKDEVTPVSPVPPSIVPPFGATVPPRPQVIPSIPIQHQIPPVLSTPQYPSPNTVKLRHASAQFYKFLHERMDLKLREFDSFGGLVRWNNDILTVEASGTVLDRFETEVLNALDEDKVVLSSEDWNKLMLMRPDKTSLFQQLVLPYRTNPNVHIESCVATLSICIVGMKEAVKDVKVTLLWELNKEITVEE